jgi:thymidylate kinase
MTLVKNIFEYLNANCNYAVLRNFEELPENLNSRDIDILICKNQFQKNKTEIISIILKSNFKIITYFNDERMLTFVCSSIKNSNVEIIQFDFFFQTSIYGVILLDGDAVLNSRVYNGKIYHVTKEYQFLDKYLYLKFLGISFPEKYGKLRNEMEQSQLLPVLLKKIINCGSLEEIEKLSSSALKRRKILLNLKKQPFYQLLMFGSFGWNYFKNILLYKGISIGFTGPDGSGKTTVIEEVRKELSVTYSGIDLFHFRPHLIPNLGEAAHKTNLKSEVDRNYSDPHRGNKTGVLNSFIRTLYYSIDYIFGFFIRIRPMLHKRHIVIFDRYFTDICADSRRSKIFLNHKFLYWFGKLFIPKLDYNILLTADREVILARKQELTSEGIDIINEKLNYLCDKQGYYLILNNGTASEAVEKILNLIFENQHLKNMKRIGK